MENFHPEFQPVVYLMGYGFRPAHMPADYIGPRMDCPMWLPAPDADVAYQGKLDPWDHMPAAGYAWGTWIPAPATTAPQVTAASLAGPIPGAPVYVRPGTPGTWQPLTPIWPDPWAPIPEDPCHCVVPQPPIGPQPAPVSVMGDAGSLLLAAIAILYGRRLWRAAGRFGDWFTAERGGAPHQNGWI